MSYCSIDLAPQSLDVFDGRREAEKQARAACEQLIYDDEGSMVSDTARLVTALYLIVGALTMRMSHVELAKMLRDLAKHMLRGGRVVQHGRIMSLD